MNANRPYFRFNVRQLTHLLAAARTDAGVIEEILHELRFRKTTDAVARLRSDALSALQDPPASPARPALAPSPERELSPLVAGQFPTLGADRPEPDPGSIRRGAGIGDLVDAEPVLAVWTAVEVLTPHPLPKAHELEAIGYMLVRREETPFPWTEARFAPRGKERRVFWWVYLAELDLARALANLIEQFPDGAPDELIRVSGTTTLAVVVLDSNGCPVAGQTTLSSFAWGYGKVRAGQLKELAGFVAAEGEWRDRIERRLIRQDEAGRIQPVASADLDPTVRWLIKGLNLPADEVIGPGIAVRIPQFSAFGEPPEPALLNSFFLKDLARVRTACGTGDVGRGLSTYLGMSPARPRQDVVAAPALLQATLAPSRMPLVRWPGRGRYPLFLMQQAAVNHCVHDLTDDGIVGVNGPPGTGKTTLLRDIVAKVILDRAMAMSAFEKPETAFTHVARMKSGNAFVHLYRLDERLLGHEIVVASSNNRAVENISREIPDASAIADDFRPPLTYFQSVSDAVAAGRQPVVDGTTWGLAAAVLGNAANTSAFIQSFWWHEQRGFLHYLKTACGLDVPVPCGEGADPRVPAVPEIIARENPPRDEVEALRQWTAARKDFLTKLARVRDIVARTEGVFEAVGQLAGLVKSVDAACQDLRAAQTDVGRAQDQEREARSADVHARDAERVAVEDRAAVDRLRPGFFARLFHTRSFRAWRADMTAANAVVDKARRASRATHDALEASQRRVAEANGRMASRQEEKARAEQALARVRATIEAGRALVGANLADDRFWGQEDESLQKALPWSSPQLQKARDDLFAASFSLHRAFIGAAAKYFRHNIRACLDVLKGRVLSEKQAVARRSLWASLFAVVPVLSTTFASTSRLFGPLGREHLGWLLIDEAGQATPQSAVGALWRFRRAIVIGDPLQVEPVVTSPSKFITTLFSQFGLQADEWAAPAVSTQALADRRSWFGTTLRTNDGDLWVGSPLRVHRRCQEPMFGLSNAIAYNGLMVYGTPEQPSPVGQVLGPSGWIDVLGGGVDKWCPEEGGIVLELLGRLLDAGIADPDVFCITPFRVVSFKLREAIRASTHIARRLPQKASAWALDRVGTIHTFQGREADAVILVLGASQETNAGARRWAAQTPNLLNVAATRARQRLYVVGNRQAWKSHGYFQQLARCLNVKRL